MKARCNNLINFSIKLDLQTLLIGKLSDLIKKVRKVRKLRKERFKAKVKQKVSECEFYKTKENVCSLH